MQLPWQAAWVALWGAHSGLMPCPYLSRLPRPQTPWLSLLRGLAFLLLVWGRDKGQGCTLQPRLAPATSCSPASNQSAQGPPGLRITVFRFFFLFLKRHVWGVPVVAQQ